MKIVYVMAVIVFINAWLVISFLGFDLTGIARSSAETLGSWIGLRDPLYYLLFLGTVITIVVGFIFLIASPKGRA